MSKPRGIITPIKRARGLGSAHDGTHHFWVQRLTALALIPLTVWFMVELMTTIVGTDAAGVKQWLGSPVIAMLVAALIIALFWHAKLGIQVIIEDYIHHEGKKLITILVTNTLFYGFGAAALMAIAHLHFGN